MAPPPEKRAPPRPPLIGRAGNLTIFITPPPSSNISSSNANPSPVQAPPMRWEDDRAGKSSSELLYEFLCGALAKAQAVQLRLDSYVADWLGLNHSKYQRELNDYYERMGKPLKNELINTTKPKEMKSKSEAL